MSKIVSYMALLMSMFIVQQSAYATCKKDGVWLQVLGSGGPEIDDGRASSSYLIWHNGKARILIDAGSGSALQFEKSDARLNDLDLILLSHMHVDHSNDLPAIIKASYFSNRNRDLNVYGPTANDLMPSMTGFVNKLFSKNGAYPYLSDYLDDTENYRIIAHDIDASKKSEMLVRNDDLYKISAVAVHHGPIPSLAWRVEIDGQSLLFSGDMTNQYNTLATLAKSANLLVAHHAIAEQAGRVSRNLHMPPSVIGKIAAQAQVKTLVLSHRMNRIQGKEGESLMQIRRSYSGPVQFADDLECFEPL
ncbi:MAG: MBL fold metallo-hydrolase [Gammaproteobacteria bacterium]|nr:MBL fold metallo-hydrolase [Gammaproteobacteria bacterium]